MNRNFNLPPGTTARDLERQMLDMADAMDRIFERLDDRERGRRDDAVLRAAERRGEQERAFNEGVREGIERRMK